MSGPMSLEDRVEAVRAFSRFYTNTVGALREGLLQTPYSLSESRVIFELGRSEETEVADLRRRLDLDAGYLSRILSRFESDGLLARRRSGTDARRQTIHLSRRGRQTYTTLNRRSAEGIRAWLTPLAESQQQRLVGAMDDVRSILDDSAGPVSLRIRSLRSGDLGWVVQRHGALYAEEYGWDQSFEALVARIVADYADNRLLGREDAWIGEAAGRPVGCVFCVRTDERTAQLRLLLVEPDARGLGTGRTLVETCVAFARDAGYRRLTLWTNDVLVAARRLYERAGFQLTSEERHRSFGHELVGQNWTLTL